MGMDIHIASKFIYSRECEHCCSELIMKYIRLIQFCYVLPILHHLVALLSQNRKQRQKIVETWYSCVETAIERYFGTKLHNLSYLKFVAIITIHNLLKFRTTLFVIARLGVMNTTTSIGGCTRRLCRTADQKCTGPERGIVTMLRILLVAVRFTAISKYYIKIRMDGDIGSTFKQLWLH